MVIIGDESESRRNAYKLSGSKNELFCSCPFQVLADLAIWEPRTFRAVVAVAADRAMKPSSEGGMDMNACGPGTPVNLGPT